MSRFVSGGTDEQPLERDDEWRKAQEEIEAAHKRKLEEGQQNGGKTLYEVLQANKAAKQEAFEESIRLKNQFRSLDEDEVEFLDSVLESTRAKEAAIRKETTEQLELFRKQQEEAEKATAGEDTETLPAEEVQWGISGRKRRKAPEKDGFRAKLRKASSTGERASVSKAPADPIHEDENSTTIVSNARVTKAVQASPVSKAATAADNRVDIASPPKSQASIPPKVAALGLGDYSSDED